MMIACMAFDFGTTTGVSWVVAPRTAATVGEAVSRAAELGSRVVKGPTLAQAEVCFEGWRNFHHACWHEYRVHPDLVIEDFILTRFDSSDKRGLDSLRKAAAFLGFRAGFAECYHRVYDAPVREDDPVWYTPSQAMSKATDARLKHWGLWDCPEKYKDKAHIRDARRHMALHISKGLT